MKNSNGYLVAVVGAGPAGIYAAKTLASQGVQVALLNRDIKPGGLAEYGIYHDKEKMKGGLRKQFRQILTDPLIEYYGNVVVGEQGQLTLADLRQLGFAAILVTVGAQGTKWLGLPGEDLVGVYHAKDLVYHYNKLPPFSQETYRIGERVALIGAGNVMLDIAHWVVRDLKVKEAIAVVRRGPAEVKFTKKEFENVAANLDLEAFEKEMARVAPAMQAVGQDEGAAQDFILSALPKAEPRLSETCFRFDFLASPSRILGDGRGQVCGLEVAETTLVAVNGDTKTKNLGTTRVLAVDTVVFCIGDRVDETFGLPVAQNEFAKNPAPRFPIDGISYEAYDPAAQQSIPDVFLAGWAREASSGLVGVARKDGTQGAEAVAQYLATLPQHPHSLEALDRCLEDQGIAVITKTDWQRLETIEQAEAARLGLESFKFGSNEEMFAALGRL